MKNTKGNASSPGGEKTARGSESSTSTSIAPRGRGQLGPGGGSGIKILLNSQEHQRSTRMSAEDLLMEEKIMKRRLLIDGLNCDRRLANLTKTFVAFCNSGDEDVETCNPAFGKMIAQLQRVKTDAKMNYAAIVQANESKSKLEEIQEEICDEIERTKLTISDINEDLAEARRSQGKIRELDALGRLLSKQPSLNSIQEVLHILQEELQELMSKNAKLGRDLKYKTDTLKTMAGVIVMMKECTEELFEEISEGEFSPATSPLALTHERIAMDVSPVEKKMSPLVEKENIITQPKPESPLNGLEGVKEALDAVLDHITNKETVSDKLSLGEVIENLGTREIIPDELNFDYEIPPVSEENTMEWNVVENQSPSLSGGDPNNPGSGLSMDEVTLMGFRDQGEVEAVALKASQNRSRHSSGCSSGAAPTLSDGSIHSGTISISSGSLSPCSPSPPSSPSP